jgi:hypothetical protein
VFGGWRSIGRLREPMRWGVAGLLMCFDAGAIFSFFFWMESKGREPTLEHVLAFRLS